MNSTKKKRQQLTLRLTDELDRTISVEAAKIGMSKNAYISMVLSQYIKRLTKTGTE